MADKYYVLRYDDAGNESFEDLDRPSIDGYEMVRFDDGVFIPESLPLIVFESAIKGKLYDYIPSALPGMIVSDNFKAALDRTGIDNIQYFPALIRDRKAKQDSDGYFVANIVGLIDCMDMEQSDYEVRAGFPDKLRGIDELHLNYSKLRNEKIFRLKQWPTMILVHEEVKKSLEGEKLKGIKFLDAEGHWT